MVATHKYYLSCKTKHKTEISGGKYDDLIESRYCVAVQSNHFWTERNPKISDIFRHHRRQQIVLCL